MREGEGLSNKISEKENIETLDFDETSKILDEEVEILDFEKAKTLSKEKEKEELSFGLYLFFLVFLF